MTKQIVAVGRCTGGGPLYLSTGDGIMKKVFRWKCPYCGRESTAIHDDEQGQYSNTQLVYCDPDEGGCDKQSVLRSKIEIAWEVFTFNEMPATSGQSTTPYPA